MHGDILDLQFIYGVSGGESFVAPDTVPGGIIGTRFILSGANWIMSLLGVF